jgi:hypothetical protein
MSETTQALVDRLAGDDEELKKQLLAYGREIQTDFELNEALDLAEPETGRGVFVAACADLRSRGIHPDTADQETLLAALKRVSA